MKQINLNTAISGLCTILVTVLAFIGRQLVTDVKANNDILIEVRTNQRQVMEDVAVLKRENADQNRRLDVVESVQTYEIKRLDHVEHRVGSIETKLKP